MAFYKKITNITLKNPIIFSNIQSTSRSIHVSSYLRSLMEFFDKEQNWGQREIKVGRSWRKEELRIKSNTDLHKLWYVLLKEHNMLLTMEHECKETYRLFPNPERIDKVKESMTNLEDVVRERNRAYYLLETGETGERPVKQIRNVFGLHRMYKMIEHSLPEFMKKKSLNNQITYQPNNDTEEFILKYNEQRNTENRRLNNRNKNHVLQLLKRFPNIDMNYLKELYPKVNIDKIKHLKKARGHFPPPE